MTRSQLLSWKTCILIVLLSSTAVFSFILGWMPRSKNSSFSGGLTDLTASYKDYEDESTRYREMRAVYPENSDYLNCQGIVADLAFKRYQLEIEIDVCHITNEPLDETISEILIMPEKIDSAIEEIHAMINRRSIRAKKTNEFDLSDGMYRLLPPYIKERRDGAVLQGYYEKAIESRDRLIARASKEGQVVRKADPSP